MREREPMTQSMNASHVKRQFSELLTKVSHRETRVLIEEAGKPVAGLVSPDDLQRLNQLDAEWEEDWAVFDRIHARNRDKDPEEVERDVAEAIAEIRRKERAKRKPRAAR